MADETKTDKLKLVADNDERELARQRENATAERAALQLRSAMRVLAANILRIIAGAGKDYAVIGQTIDLLKAYNELQPLSGSASYPYAPSTPMVDGLRERDWRSKTEGYNRPTEEDLARWRRDGEDAVQDAKADIAQAALRLIAAQLTAQPTQESVAENQLIDAINRFEKARQVRSERWNQEWARRRSLQDPTSLRDSPGKATAPRTAGNSLERTLDAKSTRAPTKKIGIYDALDEQNRKRREKAKPKPELP